MAAVKYGKNGWMQGALLLTIAMLVFGGAPLLGGQDVQAGTVIQALKMENQQAVAAGGRPAWYALVGLPSQAGYAFAGSETDYGKNQGYNASIRRTDLNFAGHENILHLATEEDEEIFDVTETADGEFAATGYLLKNSRSGDKGGGISPRSSLGASLGYDDPDADGMLLVGNLNTGNYRVCEYYDNGENDRFNAVIQTADGGYAVVGSSRNTERGDLDILIVKYSSDGVILWDARLGGTGEDVAEAVAETSDADGNRDLILVGHTKGGLDSDAFSKDPESGVMGGISMFVGRVRGADQAGERKVWLKSFGGSGQDELHALVQGEEDLFYAAGFSKSVDGRFYGKNKGLSDGVLVRFTETGDLDAVRNFGGSGDDGFYTLTSAEQGTLLAGGEAESSDGDLKTNKGGRDLFFLHADAGLVKIWADSYGAAGYDSIRAMRMDAQGSFVIGGTTQSLGRNTAVTEDSGGYSYYMGKFTYGDVHQYQVCFSDPDGAGSYDPRILSSLVLRENEPYGSLPAPVRPGYLFSGWFTTPSGGVRITENTPFEAGQDQTLHARWEKETYRLIFNANGGDPTQVVSEAAPGKPYGLYGSFPPVAREGFNFKGWYSAPFEGAEVLESHVFNGLSDQTLYAKWEEKSYSIRFDSCGGGAVPDKTGLYSGRPYGQLPHPTRSGASFLGWYTEKNGGDRIVAGSVFSGKLDQKLYARWGHYVSFHVNGGKQIRERRRVVAPGETYGALPKAARPGYVFKGWYTGKKSGSRVSAASLFRGAKNETLYARWRPAKYKIAYINIVNQKEKRFSSMEVYYGEKIRKIAVVYQKGYQFKGWYTKVKGGKKVSKGDRMMFTKNTKLYARWKKL